MDTMETNLLEELQLRLKSGNKEKLRLEKRVFTLRNSERSLCDDLYLTKSEIDCLTANLEDLKDKISDSQNQYSKMAIDKTVEKIKRDSLKNGLDVYKTGFEDMFATKRDLLTLRNNKLKTKELEEQELEKQKQKQVAEQNESQLREAISIEEDCEGIERECIILKKRNNAIMLKLRRKLVETEDTRRELAKTVINKNV